MMKVDNKVDSKVDSKVRQLTGIAHIVATGTPDGEATALCGASVTVCHDTLVRNVPASHHYVICALCEAAKLLDGVPEYQPAGRMEQGRLW